MARPSRSRRTVTTLVVLVLLSITIITLDETGKASVLTSGAKSVASDVYTPLRSGVNAVLDPIGRFFAGAVDYGALQRENDKLETEVQTLEHEKDGTAAARREYEALEKLLTLDKLPSLSGLPYVVAEVTSQTVSDFAATVTIDKGRDDGVDVGDPVVGAGGLVGQVVAASHSDATVRLLTDGRSKVGVVFGTNEEATLDGQGAGKALEAQYVASTTAVSVGEVMSTSSLQGAAFPPGIPVATVSAVHIVTGADDKNVAAKPIVHMAGLLYLEVLQWAPAP